MEDQSHKIVYIYKYHGVTVPECVEIYDVHADCAQDARRAVINNYFKTVDIKKWYQAYLEDPDASSSDDDASSISTEDDHSNGYSIIQRTIDMIVSDVNKFNNTNFSVDCRCQDCYVVFHEAGISNLS